MILPIEAYGCKSLRKPTEPLEENYEGLQDIIQNMFDTMYNASGVGIAAPQIQKSISMFVVDTAPFCKSKNKDRQGDFKPVDPIKKVFINPEIISVTGKIRTFNEGCLSIPNIMEDVKRPSKVKVRYRDENWEEHEEDFTEINARVIQHEYDHLKGILFTDHLSNLKKRMLENKLNSISKGSVLIGYKMNYPKR